jgi:hypothetical protein
MDLKRHMDDVLQFLRQEETGERWRRHSDSQIKAIRKKIFTAEEHIEKAVKIIAECENLTKD